MRPKWLLEPLETKFKYYKKKAESWWKQNLEIILIFIYNQQQPEVCKLHLQFSSGKLLDRTLDVVLSSKKKSNNHLNYYLALRTQIIPACTLQKFTNLFCWCCSNASTAKDERKRRREPGGGGSRRSKKVRKTEVHWQLKFKDQVLCNQLIEKHRLRSSKTRVEYGMLDI